MTCQKELMLAGKPYPRTCSDCGLTGPCKRGYDMQWLPGDSIKSEVVKRKDKSKHQQRIEAFMRHAGQDVPDGPEEPSAEIRLLRAKLIFEEAMETITALGVDVMVDNAMQQSGPVCLHSKNHTLVVNPRRPMDMIEVADGCADISVVTIGTLSACGIADKLLLKEVDESNLRKFGPGSYPRDDGKWMKPDGWTAPDIAGVLHKQTPMTRGWIEFTDEEAKRLQSLPKT